MSTSSIRERHAPYAVDESPLEPAGQWRCTLARRPANALHASNFSELALARA